MWNKESEDIIERKCEIILERSNNYATKNERIIANLYFRNKKIYGTHLSKIILYGSYARGDFRPDSDVDIMILLDLSDLDLKKYSKELSYMTYDFNLDNDIDIKPIAKSESHFKKMGC